MDNHAAKLEADTAPAQPPRRTFFHWLTYTAGAIAAAVVGLPFVGFIFVTPRRETLWVDLGPVSKFPGGETRVATFNNPIQTPWDGVVAETNVFVRNEGGNEKGTGDGKAEKFSVFAVNCAHLGCPVSWFPQSGLFMCPCHGGVYSADGERASGPPPRGLFHCVWRVRDGRLEVQAPHFPTLQDTETKPA
jgi:Rieske Fe-S protein